MVLASYFLKGLFYAFYECYLVIKQGLYNLWDLFIIKFEIFWKLILNLLDNHVLSLLLFFLTSLSSLLDELFLDANGFLCKFCVFLKELQEILNLLHHLAIYGLLDGLGV
jgi:hypothetical protein